MYAIQVVAALLLLVSCSAPKHTKFNASNDSLNSKTTPDFETVHSRVLAPFCTSCHSQYNDYASAQREASAIAESIAAQRMPKNGGPLPEALQALVQRWVSAGAPERAEQTPVKPEPVVLEPLWSSIDALILTPRCLVCHNPQGKAKFLDLSTRNAIYWARDRLFGPGEGKRLLDFNTPENSYLLTVIQDPIEPMPPVWSNIRRLNAAEIAALTEWIGLGLP
jgi:hypothetical protein